MTTQQRIDVMLASDAGKKIQCRCTDSRFGDDWQDINKPGWNFSRYECRVKPEPQTIYRLTYPDGSIKDFNAGSEALNVLDFSIYNPTLQKIEIEL